jgi:hypothetical protein
MKNLSTKLHTLRGSNNSLLPKDYLMGDDGNSLFPKHYLTGDGRYPFGDDGRPQGDGDYPLSPKCYILGDIVYLIGDGRYPLFPKDYTLGDIDCTLFPKGCTLGEYYLNSTIHLKQKRARGLAPNSNPFALILLCSYALYNLITFQSIPLVSRNYRQQNPDPYLLYHLN